MVHKYIHSQILVNGLINSLLNGLIAFFMFRLRGQIPYSEISIDVLITVAIISFLVSWITISNTRKEVKTNHLPQNHRIRPNLPNSALVRAFIISVLCVSIFGLALLLRSIFLAGIQGLNNWVYIGIKALYAGICAGLAAFLAVRCELGRPTTTGY